MAFEFDIPLEKTESREDGGLFLTGYAATSDIDGHGDIISRDALKKMAEQIVGLPLMKTHQMRLEDEIGLVTRAELQDNGNKLFIEAKIDEDDAIGVSLFKKIAKGKKAAFSVGGGINSTTFRKGGRVIQDVKLNHLCLTNGPANKNATVLSALSKELATIEETNNGEEEMTPEEITKIVNEAVTVAQAKLTEELNTAKDEATKVKADAEKAIADAKAEAQKEIETAKNSTKEIVDGFKVALADFGKNVKGSVQNEAPQPKKEITKDELNALADKLLG